jgi:hypothetical protein
MYYVWLELFSEFIVFKTGWKLCSTSWAHLGCRDAMESGVVT